MNKKNQIKQKQKQKQNQIFRIKYPSFIHFWWTFGKEKTSESNSKAIK